VSADFDALKAGAATGGKHFGSIEEMSAEMT
jgi:hypothetical protein